MRSTFPILICCLYALIAVDATPFSKRGNAEVQQDNAKAAKPLNFWSDDKSGDDDKDNKWSKDDEDDCASRSVSVLIGTSTYAIPCLQDDSIVNLNGLIPTPEASSSAVSSSAVDSSSSAASSSDASSAADSTTTTTDSTTTTTDTTTSADSLPTFTVTLYDSSRCRGDVITTSSGYGCFNYVSESSQFLFSAGTTLTDGLTLDFYTADDCIGDSWFEITTSATTCAQNILTPFAAGLPLSYRVTSI